VRRSASLAKIDVDGDKDRFLPKIFAIFIEVEPPAGLKPESEYNRCYFHNTQQ
jgi:hypothetical protein